jgi:uncharacterized protein YbjT (DUF2867 family)
VRVRQGSFESPESLARAFEGASRVLVVSSNTAGADAVRHHRTAIEVAKGAGAEHVFYTSHVGASATSPFAPMPDHAATERTLEASGLSYTVLRNGFYADSALQLLGRAAETSNLPIPADGKTSWTAHTDLAEATAILMAEPTITSSRTLSLTASEALDFDDIARLLSEATGKTIRRTPTSDEEFRDAMMDRGVPRGRAEMLVGLFLASRLGQFSRVDPTLEGLLGRKPTPFVDVLHRSLTSAS